MKLPRIVNWLILGLIAYVLYVGNFAARTGDVATPITAETPEPTQDYRALQALTDKQRWLRAINPEAPREANITELTVGKGQPVSCGSNVRLRFRGTMADGANFDPGHDETAIREFTVGAAPINALNEGLIGMRPGGVRSLSASPLEVFKPGEKTDLEPILFRLELLEVTPTTPPDLLPITVTQLAAGTLDDAAPMGARCGDKVQVRVQPFDTEGKAIAEQTITLNALGANDALLGRAIHGMHPGEARLVVAPKALQSPRVKASMVMITRIE